MFLLLYFSLLASSSTSSRMCNWWLISPKRHSCVSCMFYLIPLSCMSVVSSISSFISRAFFQFRYFIFRTAIQYNIVFNVWQFHEREKALLCPLWRLAWTRWPRTRTWWRSYKTWMQSCWQAERTWWKPMTSFNHSSPCSKPTRGIPFIYPNIHTLVFVTSIYSSALALELPIRLIRASFKGTDCHQLSRKQ